MRLCLRLPVVVLPCRLLFGFAALTAALASPVAAAETATAAPEKIALWPGPAPVGDGTFQTSNASLTVYRPAPEKANRAAVVICPGGGYGLNGYQGPMWDAWQTKSLEWLAKQKLVP